MSNSARLPVGGEKTPSSEWRFYRASAQGREVFRKELEALPRNAAAAMALTMRRFLAGASRNGDEVKAVRDGILELRCRVGNDQFRLLFFKWGAHVVALTVFAKKQQRTPQSALELAKARRRTWKQNFGDAPPR